ncbi:MAG TPA: hypothetical protein VKB52_08280 [Rhodanobacteraceae bacterium]|nr:hypothetical protein [Rhodanobacteraceae bacterium]
MNFLKSHPAATALVLAIGLGTTGFAAASDSGLSQNEHAAQQAIVSTPAQTSGIDTRVATLADNERAARNAIASAPVLGTSSDATGETSLAANELAAQHAIVDAPAARYRIVAAEAITGHQAEAVVSQ